MRILCLFLLTASPAAAQFTGLVSSSEHVGAVVIDVYGGHGTPGSPDGEVTVVPGPAGGWTQPLTSRHFQAARSGAPAQVLLNAPFAITELTTHPKAQWIGPDQGSGAGTSQVPGLFAIEFDVPDIAILSAKMDLDFSVDEALGLGPNQGVFLNEQPVPNTKQAFGADGQYHFAERTVTGVIRPGKNTLYLYMINNAFYGGLLFHAQIRINDNFPDECTEAIPVHLGDTSGETHNYTTSAAAGACGLRNDRWYVFVPPASGTLTATLGPVGGAPYSPALGLFSGSCGSLTQVACAAGTTTTAATWSGPVSAGEPLLLSVGGATRATGEYDLRLEIAPNQTGLIYSGNGHLYVVTPSVMDIFSARTWAQQQGGYLAAVNDAAENDWITNQLGASSMVWLGLSDEISEGTWLWDSGEPYIYNNWNAGEPNDHPLCGGEDYVEIVGGGLWNDIASGGTPPCLCCAHTRRGLVEIPSTGLASVFDLGGACGPTDIPPALYSEPHKLGTTADLAVIGVAPHEPVLVFRSPQPASPGTVGSCTLHLDLFSATLALHSLTNEYGSVSLSVDTPSLPSLIGLTENWQAQIVPSMGSSYYSNALELKIGN